MLRFVKPISPRCGGLIWRVSYICHKYEQLVVVVKLLRVVDALQEQNVWLFRKPSTHCTSRMALWMTYFTSITVMYEELPERATHRDDNNKIVKSIATKQLLKEEFQEASFKIRTGLFILLMQNIMLKFKICHHHTPSSLTIFEWAKKKKNTYNYSS